RPACASFPSLPPTDLRRVPHLAQAGQDFLAMIALDFNSPFRDRAARGTQRLELPQQRSQVRRRRVEAGDDRHRLAAAALLAPDRRGLIFGQQNLARRIARTAAFSQRLLASRTSDRPLQWRSVKEAHFAMIHQVTDDERRDKRGEADGATGSAPYPPAL